MRIVWLSHFIPWPPKSGALQRSYNLLRQAAAVHDVRLVALNQPGLLPPTETRNAIGVLTQFCSSATAFAIPSERSRLHWGSMVAQGLLRKTPYDVNWLYSKDMMRYVRDIAGSGDVGLVHVDTLGLMPYADLFQGIPLVLNHHNAESHMMERRALLESSWLLRRYLRFERKRLARLEFRACSAVDINIAVSDLDADRLRAVAGEVPIAVVKNGVDLDYFQPVDAADPRTLVFVGGMDLYANRSAVQLLVGEIWPRLASDPSWRLIIVGRNPIPELLEAARDPRVSAPGFVDDVRPYIAAAGIYVCPIRDGGGTRLKVLDALAMGKALIATRLAVEGIEVEDGVHYLSAETVDDFVAQIRRVAAQSDLRKALGREGRAFVEARYGWESIGKRLLDAYEFASARRRSASERDRSNRNPSV